MPERLHKGNKISAQLIIQIMVAEYLFVQCFVHGEIVPHTHVIGLCGGALNGVDV